MTTRIVSAGVINRRTVAHGAIVGLIGGLLAAIAMSLAHRILSDLEPKAEAPSPKSEDPTIKVARAATSLAGYALPEHQERPAGAAVHYAIPRRTLRAGHTTTSGRPRRRRHEVLRNGASAAMRRAPHTGYAARRRRARAGFRAATRSRGRSLRLRFRASMRSVTRAGVGSSGAVGSLPSTLALITRRRASE